VGIRPRLRFGERIVPSLVIANARVLTMGGPGIKRGAAMRELGVVELGHVVVEGDRVVEVGRGSCRDRVEMSVVAVA